MGSIAGRTSVACLSRRGGGARDRGRKSAVTVAFCALVLLSCRASVAGAGNELFAPLLSLEAVPLMVAPATSLPAPATWPMGRHERRLRFFAVLDLRERAAPYQRIARRCNAGLELAFLAPGSDRGTDAILTLSHTHDKWIEAAKDPSPNEVAEVALQQVRDALAGGKYDVVFSEKAMPELEAFVKSGGVWVVCGRAMPPDDSPLAALWPARPTSKQTWHDQGAQRDGAAEVAGLPLERLSAWQYHGLYQAAQGAEALATGQAGAAFVRRVGKGAILLVPTGPISKTHDAIARLHRLLDHDEIWLRFWDHVLHGLTSGGEDLSVTADLRSLTKETPAGQEIVLPGTLLNRGKIARKVVASVHVVSPLGKVVHATEPREVLLEPGKGFDWDSGFPIASDWQSGLYSVYLTVSDPATKKQLHQAWAFVPVNGAVKLSVTSDKPGYRIGEQAIFTVDASSSVPWKGELRWAIHDFRGRVLGTGTIAAELDAQAKKIPFTWTLADHGVRVDTMWATVVAVQNDREWARGAFKIYKHERWSMRNEYQWSTWSHMACLPPSVAPRAMELMAHAGLNAMGYPAGGGELYYPAERWGWRIYDEGVGTNTFSPVIESVTDEEIEAAQRRQRQVKPTLKSGALVLASVGEEAGYKSGWGRTYYWDEPVAPEKACQAFQRFLKERYPSLEILNAAWNTRYRSWDEVKLTNEFSGKSPTLAADGWAHPKDSPLGEGAKGVTLAPYTDTAAFYHWYYDKVVRAALKILRDEVNPVPLTMASAPSSWIFNPPSVDVRLAEAGGWTESQEWSNRGGLGREPGFGIAWGHFDWPVATENVLWGWVIERSGHNNYWVDVPLMFNPDMTLTRGAWAIRRWRAQTTHAERLLLDAVPVGSDAAVLGPAGSFANRMPSDVAGSVKVALSQGGFGFVEADVKGLAKHKIVFAVFRDNVSKAEAEALSAYVESGGTLVLFPRFAGKDKHGVAHKVVPGFDLAEKWGLKITGGKDPVPQHFHRESVRADLSVLGQSFTGVVLQSPKALIERIQHHGWTELARYPDKTPALLSRRLGKGRIVCVNAAYQSQWYIQHVTPTDIARQGFYRLIEKLCTDAGVGRAYKIEGDLKQVLHTAALRWSDPTGQIGYVVARTHGQTIWTNGTLSWLGAQSACYDVYGGDPAQPAPVYGKEIAMQLRPGAGRLLAFTAVPVKTVKITSTAGKITAGEALAFTVEILDAAGKHVPGEFPLDIRVSGPAGEIPGLRREVSLASGKTVRIPTAINDPPAAWTIQVREGISRLKGQATVDVAASRATAGAPAFHPWGQPSEHPEPDRMPATEFVDLLQRLATVYRTDRAVDGWDAKQRLGAHYCFFPGTRHELVRQLVQTDWPRHAKALGQAVSDGAHLILAAEDLGLDLSTGLPAWPTDAKQADALASALAGAAWECLSSDGETVRASLGKGSVVLSRTGPDGASSTWGAAAAWQRDLLQTLAAKAGAKIPAPDARRLSDWLAGHITLAPGPRTILWSGGHETHQQNTPTWQTEWTARLQPASVKPGPVFVLRLPPAGVVKKASLDLSVAGEAGVSLDIGAYAKSPVDAPKGESTVKLPPEALNDYLAWRQQHCARIERDLNGWRLIPIRFSPSAQTEITVRRATLVIE